MTPRNSMVQACQSYVSYFETLSPAIVNQLDLLAVENMVFEDPFHRLTTRQAIKVMFEKMFLNMEQPKFEVYDVFWKQTGDAAILKWRFTGHARKIGQIDFIGLSEVSFNSSGQVVSHVDYWDVASGFYTKLPVIGLVMKWLRAKIAAASC